jgi:hypothetical protein
MASGLFGEYCASIMFMITPLLPPPPQPPEERTRKKKRVKKEDKMKNVDGFKNFNCFCMILEDLFIYPVQ